MKCPIDDSPLSVSSRDGVEIDFCPQCRGVWLDRGELDKIIDRVATLPPPGQGFEQRPAEPRRVGRNPDDDRYRDDDRDRDDDRYRGGKRKRRSFLDDLFDFD